LKKIKELFRESLFLNAIFNFIDLIYDKLSESFFGGIFTSYDSEVEAAENSLTVNILKKINLKPLKFRVIKGFEHSSILNFIMKQLRKMMLYSVSVYGIFLFSFGLYTTIIYFLSVYAFNLKEMDILNLIIGIFLMIASFPMLFVKVKISDLMCKSRIMSFLLFKVFGARKESIQISGTVIIRNNIAFLLGMIVGLSSYFLAPEYILLGIIALVGIFTFIMIPEFGIVTVIFVVPFVPTMFLAGLIIFVTICYFLKLIRGKRTLKFEIIDVSIFIFLLLTILGGIFSVSRETSIRPALLYSCFILGYFLVVNLIRTSEWVKRCIVSLTFSAFIVALYGIYENFFGMVEQTWQDEELFEDIRGRVVSTFENPNVLAEYLIMILPLMIAIFLFSKKINQKLVFLMMTGVSGLCLIFTWSRGAWLGFLIGMLLFLLIYHRKSMILLLGGLISLPLLPVVLPQNIIDRFLSIGNIQDTSTSYRVNIWRAVIEMIKDNFSSGIGIGEGAFTVVYPKYSLAGIESAPHSHNLFLQIIVEIGIFGLIIFLAAMIIYMQNNFSLYKKLGDNIKYTETKLLSAAGFCGIVSVLIQGMTDYIWYNYRVFFVFWLVVALTIAVRRCAMLEWTERNEDDTSADLIYENTNYKRLEIRSKGNGD